MSGFKLLAIRPLEGCDEKYRKNLKEGMLYKFYQDYQFFVKDHENEVELTPTNFHKYRNSIISRIKPPKQEVDLYSHRDLKINISAVVGKNGSGKSALTELFLKAMFDLSIENEWISKNQLISQFQAERDFINKQIEILENEIIPELSKSIHERGVDVLAELGRKRSKYAERLKGWNDFVNQLDNLEESKLFLEIVFINEKNDQIIIRREKTDEKIAIEGLLIKGEKYDYKELFYTIFLNYSIYGLNAFEIGAWIDFLYHKNDGYLTPVVINPQKTDGNIDVNREEELSQYRINRAAISTGRILDIKILKIKFYEKKKQYNYAFEYDWDNDTLFINNIPEEAKYSFNIGEKSNAEFLKKIFVLDNSIDELDSTIIDNITKYFLGKLFKTNNLYKLDAFQYDVSISQYKMMNLTEFCINNIFENKSHKLLKLRQVIDLLKNKQEIYFEIDQYVKKNDWVEFETFKNKLNLDEDPDLLISFTSMFNIDYFLEDNSQYSKFSSGQKQLVNTIETINYHIRNLASNREDYHSINIVLDEVELYFHPEYQRTLVKKMIDSFKTLNLSEEYTINILFLTHSPFILSDIPSENILRLKAGVPQGKPEKGTFGANVHDLLHDSFFLEDGFMGKFAEEKINEVINWINHELLEQKINILQENIEKSEQNSILKEKLILEKSKLQNQKKDLLPKNETLIFNDCLLVVNLVGEPALQNKLLSMLYEVNPTEEIDYLREINAVKKKYGKE